MEPICSLCKRGISQLSDRGIYLTRVNPTGVDGIWACAPSCDGEYGSQEDALLGALDSNGG